MPLAKMIAEKLFEEEGVLGWTPVDHVDELKGKLHLKSKNKDAYTEGTDLEKSVYESTIQKYRKDNKDLRKTVKSKENGNEYVINTAFRDAREYRLAVGRLTAEDAETELHEKACDTVKALDLWQYERKTKEEEVKALRFELEQTIAFKELSSHETLTEQDVTRLENAADKVVIKLSTAKILSNRYGEIIERLKMNSLSQPPLLDKMETALLHTQAELNEIKCIAQNASLLRDESDEKLREMQRETAQARRERTGQLERMRAEAQRKKEALQTKERSLRTTRPALSENTEHKAIAEAQRKQNMQKKVLALESSFQQIKEATHVNELHSVLPRIATQRRTQEELRKRVENLEKQRAKLSEEYSSKRQKFQNMKYSGEQKYSRGQRTLADLQERVRKCEDESITVGNTTKINGATLVNVKEAVASLSERLVEVKLPPPEHSYSRGDTFEQLDTVTKKLDRLMEDVGATTEDFTLKGKFQMTDFQDFLLKRVGPGNVRVKLHPSVGVLHDFDTEDCWGEAPTRKEIKLQGEKLIEAKTKQKKRKPPPRKKQYTTHNCLIWKK